MVYNLVDLEESEQLLIRLRSTHFNLYYNKSTYYERVVRALLNEITKEVSKTNKRKLNIIEFALRSFITNSARAIKTRFAGITIPRDHHKYKQTEINNPQKISFSGMKVVMDSLEKQGYIDMYIGGLSDFDLWNDNIKTLKSYVMFNSKFLDLWKGVNLSNVKPIDLIPIEIRKRKSNEILDNRGRKTGNMKKQVEDFNKKLLDTHINAAGIEIPAVMYKRVFTDCLEMGGRFYDSNGGLQTMPSNLRGTIKIDGCDTVELDYTCLHPSIAYTLKGIELDPNFSPYNADLSFIGVEEETIDMIKQLTNNSKYNPLRNIAKYALLCGINSDSLESCTCAVSTAKGIDYRKWKRFQESGDLTDLAKVKYIGLKWPTPVKDICVELLNHNYQIEEAFFSDVGINYQYYDSQMTSYIIQAFLQIDEVALPWHDSYVCKVELEDYLREVMVEAYRSVLGTGMNCRIDKKF